MSILNSARTAITTSLRQTRNVPGTCQLTVRAWFDADSVGDYDGDGDADAVDGWKSEPLRYRHPGDRTPPGGRPLSFHGGSKGYGHRAMTLRDPGRIRSTDMLNNRYTPGVTSTVVADTTSAAIAILEKQMGVDYTGYSDSMDGQPIPKTQWSRGARVDRILTSLRVELAATKPKTRKRALLLTAIKTLRKIPQHAVN